MTYPRFLPVHRKVEFILIALCGLLPEPLQTILLGVVVPCTLDIVLVLLEKAEPLSVGKLGALLVVAPVEGIAQRGSHGYP